MGRRRILLALVSAAALWRATAMDDTDEFIAAAPAANPFDGTGCMSAGQLFYGDERAGRQSYAQRNYEWFTGPEGPGLEVYKDVISDFTESMMSIEHWKDLRDRLIATLSRDVSLGAMTIRRELKDIWEKYKSKDYIPSNAVQNTVSTLARAGVVMKKKFAPGPLCEKVGAQPAYVSLALVASGLVAHFSGLITLNLGEMFAAACHWGFFFLTAVALGLYSYTRDWEPVRNKLGLFVLMMYTRILLTYFMCVVIANWEYMQGLSTFVHMLRP